MSMVMQSDSRFASFLEQEPGVPALLTAGPSLAAAVEVGGSFSHFGAAVCRLFGCSKLGGAAWFAGFRVHGSGLRV